MYLNMLIWAHTYMKLHGNYMCIHIPTCTYATICLIEIHIHVFVSCLVTFVLSLLFWRGEKKQTKKPKMSHKLVNFVVLHLSYFDSEPVPPRHPP